jgi:uncharacterized DUF497 family protein
MSIEWDPAKAKSNHIKHGVRFSDVEPAFYDEFALSMPDPFAAAEERFILVGRDALSRVLTIAYTYRGEHIRVISARSATKAERRAYEKGIRP